MIELAKTRIILRWIFAPIAAALAFIIVLVLACGILVSLFGFPSNWRELASFQKAGGLRVLILGDTAFAVSCIAAVVSGAVAAPPSHRKFSRILFPTLIFFADVALTFLYSSQNTQESNLVDIMLAGASCALGWLFLRSKTPHHERSDS